MVLYKKRNKGKEQVDKKYNVKVFTAHGIKNIPTAYKNVINWLNNAPKCLKVISINELPSMSSVQITVWYTICSKELQEEVNK